ncbi:protein phosphatase 2c, putative, partial [Ichthyophthirius multifiliis]
MNLPQKIEDALARELNNIDNDFIENSLNLSFLQASKALLESNIDCTFSGSTCVLTLIIGNKIWTANAGDSRAVLCQLDIENNWISKQLTRDHKPNELDEFARIIQRGGRVESYKDENNNHLGPCRVWLKNQNIPGLAMSRSFGDVIASQVGVICEPEIFQYEIQNSDKFIIIASDGVWEFIQNQNVMELIIPSYLNNQIQKACENIINESVFQWKL